MSDLFKKQFTNFEEATLENASEMNFKVSDMIIRELLPDMVADWSYKQINNNELKAEAPRVFSHLEAKEQPSLWSVNSGSDSRVAEIEPVRAWGGAEDA